VLVGYPKTKTQLLFLFHFIFYLYSLFCIAFILFAMLTFTTPASSPLQKKVPREAIALMASLQIKEMVRKEQERGRRK
jgi:hypothetical protein